MTSTIHSRWRGWMAEDLSANPTRLVEEALTIPLFGGRAPYGSRRRAAVNIAPAVRRSLNAPAVECRVVIEAGDLRRNAPLRTP